MELRTQITLKWRAKEVIKKVEQIASNRMLESAQAVRTQVLETLSGSRSGRTYNVPGTRRKYTASAPGQPPATATAELRQSIKASVKGEGKEVIGTVGTDKKQGLMTEFGTRNMAARPWLRVSLEKTLPKLRGIWRKRWF